MLTLVRVSALLSALLAILALLGYAVDPPFLIYVQPGLRGMAPLTAAALLALVLSVFAFTFGRAPFSLVGALVGAAAGAVALATRAFSGADTIDPRNGGVAFQIPLGEIGRTSSATALCVLLVAASLVTRRRNPRVADSNAAAALLVSGAALLGYLYGVRDL